MEIVTVKIGDEVRTSIESGAKSGCTPTAIVAAIHNDEITLVLRTDEFDSVVAMVAAARVERRKAASKGSRQKGRRIRLENRRAG